MRLNPAWLASLVLAVGMSTSSAAQGYPEAPLRLPVDTGHASAGAILRWLRQQEAPPPEALARAREDLYGIAADRLRARVAAGGPAWKGAPDTLLAATFDVAARAGAIGARRVGHTLLPGVITDEQLVAPAHTTLAFEAPVFRLTDVKQGWEVTFPFYYMISQVARQPLADGREYLVVMLSTLDAPHSPAGTGRSQATILLVASPDGTVDQLVDFWRGQLGMSSGPQTLPPGLNVPGARYYVGYDAPQSLRKAFLVLPATQGAVGVAYIGREGAYQANEADYHEFVRRLAASRGRPGGPVAAPNPARR
jgi:hypothetical protein